MRKTATLFLLIILLNFLCETIANLKESEQKEATIDHNEFHVGIVVDMSTQKGMLVHSCISMAISDIYTAYPHYKSRLLLQTVDSKGEALHALSAAVNLLENNNVTAIIGGQTSPEAKFLAELGEKAKVPIISFSQLSTPSPRSINYPYFVQVTEDDISQAEGIAAIIETFKWRDVILIYEDDKGSGRDFIWHLYDSFGPKNIQITYKIAIGTTYEDDQIFKELQELMALKQTTVLVVHASNVVVSRICLNAKRLGMMSEGYAWIATAKSMNHFHYMDYPVIVSMQGVIGFKSNAPFPSSGKLVNFTRRLRGKIQEQAPGMEVMELTSAYNLWAYDVGWALAKAAEKVNVELALAEKLETSMVDLFLKEILQSRFTGLSGDFQFVNGKLVADVFQIINVIGRGERRIGYWNGNIARDLSNNIRRHLSSTSKNDLDAVIWPGGSSQTPQGYTLQATNGKKLRVGVPLSGFKELVHVEHDLQTNTTIVRGFCIDVFKAAIDYLKLPYDVHYEFLPFVNATGQSAGTYNDLIYQIYLQKFDVVIGDTTITSNRSLYVDFTIPYTESGVGMLALAPQKENEKAIWFFLKPLTADLWLSSAGFFLFTGFVVWAIEHGINSEFQGSPSQQFGKLFYFSFSTLVFAHRERLLSNLSRFVMIIWVFVVLIVTSSYTASLTSLLTVQRIQYLNPEKNNVIGYQRGSFAQGIINNLNFESSHLQPFGSPEEYAQALSRGSKNGGVSAIIDEMPYIRLVLAKYSNQFSMIGPVVDTTNGFGFAFPKGSPMVHDMSRAIAKLREEGKLTMIENPWFKSRSKISSDDSMDDNNNVKPLTFESFRGLFLISGISSTSALVIFYTFFLRENWQWVRSCCSIARERFRQYISKISFRRIAKTNVMHPI